MATRSMIALIALVALMHQQAPGAERPNTFRQRHALTIVSHRDDAFDDTFDGAFVGASCYECGCCAVRSLHFHGLHARVDMYPHSPYLDGARGYYYFVPYNVSHLTAQQAAARRWGSDPRNPYDNRMLDRIADDLQDVPLQPEVSEGLPPHGN